MFPIPPEFPGRATASRAQRVFTNHESRNKAFMPPYPRFPGISRPPHPPRSRVRAPFASATRPVGFSRVTKHETWFFPVPPATPKRAIPSRAQRVFTNHESRNTNHGIYRPSVPRGCARVAQPETPARTAAHAARSLLSCALWRGMGRLWRGMGGILSPNRRPRAVRCEIPAMCTKSRFPRKMREVLRSPLLPSPSGLNLLRWTRMDTPLPPPRQKRLSFVLIRVHSW